MMILVQNLCSVQAQLVSLRLIRDLITCVRLTCVSTPVQLCSPFQTVFAAILLHFPAFFSFQLLVSWVASG